MIVLSTLHGTVGMMFEGRWSRGQSGAARGGHVADRCRHAYYGRDLWQMKMVDVAGVERGVLMCAIQMRMFATEMAGHAIVARKGTIAAGAVKVAPLRVRHLVPTQVGTLDEGSRASLHLATKLAGRVVAAQWRHVGR